MSTAGVQHDRRPAIKPVVGDRSNLPTVRFSGGADAQLRLEHVRVAGCSRLPLAVGSCRRCRHGCRQDAALVRRGAGLPRSVPVLVPRALALRCCINRPWIVWRVTRARLAAAFLGSEGTRGLPPEDLHRPVWRAASCLLLTRVRVAAARSVGLFADRRCLCVPVERRQRVGEVVPSEAARLGRYVPGWSSASWR